MIVVPVIDPVKATITPHGERPIITSSDSTATTLTVDHNDLLKRDANNSHPITAITGLRDELDELYDLIGHNTFIFLKDEPSMTWNINHNLNCYPSVTIVDDTGEVVIGDIKYIDVNNVQLSFSAEFSGKAYLN